MGKRHWTESSTWILEGKVPREAFTEKELERMDAEDDELRFNRLTKKGAPMTDRTEPSDKPAEEKAGKPDRDEIARDLTLEWHKQRNAFYPPDSFWEWLAKRVVPRTEHEQLKQEYERLKKG